MKSKIERLPPQVGLVISRYSKWADIEDEHGQIHRCDIKRGVGSLVVGDWVYWCADQPVKGRGMVEAVLERRTCFMRLAPHGLKIIAANIDRVVIVSAVMPPFSLNLIDRYLIACEIMQIKPILVLNKIDLLSLNDKQKMIQTLSLYQRIDCPVLLISTLLSEGIDQLRESLSTDVAVLVGQSGVGKSSLINSLLPSSDRLATISEVSATSGLGRHTTTVARLYHLSGGAAIIDSPGIRQFSLWDLTPAEVASGFIEFNDYIGHCYFRDCQHRDDPGCALREAVMQGLIAKSRFENYHQIIDSMATIKRGSYHSHRSGQK